MYMKEMKNQLSVSLQRFFGYPPALTAYSDHQPITPFPAATTGTNPD